MRYRQRVRPIAIYPKQHEFVSIVDKWIRGFVGGRGTGKTWTGSYMVINTAKRSEPWLGVSPDSGVVSETTFPIFVEVAKKCGVYLRQKLTPYRTVWFRTRDGGTASIVFRSGERPEKLRGGNYAGLWIDEASVVVKLAYDLAIATLRWRGKMGPVILTFTPKGRQHWTFEKFFTPAEEETIESLLRRSAKGGDGANAPGFEYIQGRAYQHNTNTRLIQARTLDNPFLPDNFYSNLRSQYSSMFSEQELEGLFVDIAGLLFRREWFLSVDKAPRDARRARYWDRAATPGGGSYSAGVLLAIDPRGVIYVEDVIRGQWSWEDRNRVMTQKAEEDYRKYGGEVITYTEQEGASGGKEVSQQIVRMLAGHPVYIDNVSGVRHRKVDGQKLPGEAKVIRAMGFSGQAEAGNVRIVRGPWNADYLDEMVGFPETIYSDQVDATSGAFNNLIRGIIPDTEGPVKTRIKPDSDRFGAALALETVRKRRSNS